MGKTIQVHPHLSLAEIDGYVKTSKSPVEARRWLIIRSAQAEPSTAEKLGSCFGLATGSIRNLIELYNRVGPSSLRKPSPRKQSHGYLSFEEEKNFILLGRSE